MAVMYQEEFFDYKNQFIGEICSDQEIVGLLTANESAAVPDRSLPYTQVFPYEYVPETESDAKTFICVDVDIVSVPNSTFYTLAIYVWVFAHKSQLRLSNGRGVITDKLASAIDRLANGSRDYGLGRLKLVSSLRFAPITDYQGRVLTFSATDFNRDGSKKVPIPSNRKNRCAK